MPDRPLDLPAIEAAHLPCRHAEGEGPDPDCTLCALAAMLAAFRGLRAAADDANQAAWNCITEFDWEAPIRRRVQPVLEALGAELGRVRDA